MSRHIYQLFLGLCFIAIGQFAQAQESQQLEPNKPIERETAGGQEHIYKISLAAGQFVRFRLEQRVIDAALTLSAPGGKQLVEMNLTSGGEQESLRVARSNIVPNRGLYFFSLNKNLGRTLQKVQLGIPGDTKGPVSVQACRKPD